MINDTTRLLADITSAQMRNSFAASDAVIEGLRAEVKQWRSAFVRLYEEVDEAAQIVTSRRLESVIDRTAPLVDIAYRAHDVV